MNPKDRSLICRMASNILITYPHTGRELDVIIAVDIAIDIIEETDRRIAEEDEDPT